MFGAEDGSISVASTRAREGPLGVLNRATCDVGTPWQGQPWANLPGHTLAIRNPPRHLTKHAHVICGLRQVQGSRTMGLPPYDLAGTRYIVLNKG